MQHSAEGVSRRVRCAAQMVFARRKRTEGSKHFRRLCDKKINALAMAALLTVPDAALPQEVSAGLGQLMAGLLKLLTTLRAQQARVLSPCSPKCMPVGLLVAKQDRFDLHLTVHWSDLCAVLMVTLPQAGLENLGSRVTHRMWHCLQDVALDEDEEDDEEEDLVSESEDEDAFEADGAADEDGNLGDDEDADGEVDDAYLKRLERESRRLKVGHAQCLACSFSFLTFQCLYGSVTGCTQHLCTDEERSKHVQL